MEVLGYLQELSWEDPVSLERTRKTHLNFPGDQEEPFQMRSVDAAHEKPFLLGQNSSTRGFKLRQICMPNVEI